MCHVPIVTHTTQRNKSYTSNCLVLLSHIVLPSFQIFFIQKLQTNLTSLLKYSNDVSHTSKVHFFFLITQIKVPENVVSIQYLLVKKSNYF